MAKLSDHASSDFVKLMYIGDSGTGKTGSLAALVEAGYDLRILDMDNGLDILRNILRHKDPALLEHVDYETRYDRMKKGPAGMMLAGSPKAFNDALALMDKWSDDSIPAEWGAKTIFVIDTLTSLARAAHNWFTALNPSAKDGRAITFLAQKAIEDVIANICAEEFHTNVIVLSHVEYTSKEGVPPKGYAAAVGKALGPKLPKYFNTLVLAESIGTGTNTKRRIKTVPTGIVDVKVANPYNIAAELPLETGLVTLFEQLKGN